MLVGLGQGLVEGFGGQRAQWQRATDEAPGLGQGDQLGTLAMGQAGLDAILQEDAVALGEAERQAPQRRLDRRGVHPCNAFMKSPGAIITTLPDGCAAIPAISLVVVIGRARKPVKNLEYS